MIQTPRDYGLKESHFTQLKNMLDEIYLESTCSNEDLIKYIKSQLEAMSDDVLVNDKRMGFARFLWELSK